MLPNKAVGSVCAFGYSIQVILSYDTSPEAEKISEECIESLYSKRAWGMPPLAAESGLVSRIVSQREVMISLAGLALVLLTLLLGRGSAAVLLLNANDESRSFPDMEASFGTFLTLIAPFCDIHFNFRKENAKEMLSWRISDIAVLLNDLIVVEASSS